MTLVSSALLDGLPFIRWGISTRIGGVSDPPYGLNLSYHVGDDPSRVTRNREIFFGHLGIPLERLAVPGQVHGATILTVDSPGSYAACDALLTSVPDLYLCLTVADCIPIFLVDTERHTLGAVHAGWRGTAARIAGRAVQKMGEDFGSDPGDMLAFLGPGAASCCYEVGADVAEQFENTFIREHDGKQYLDVRGANVQQLVRAGIPAASIEASPACTISEAELYHSFRREGKRSGRMMGVIGLRGSD